MHKSAVKAKRENDRRAQQLQLAQLQSNVEKTLANQAAVKNDNASGSKPDDNDDNDDQAKNKSLASLTMGDSMVLVTSDDEDDEEDRLQNYYADFDELFSAKVEK